jgi:7-keto-8-aminopelargonate synthetase-like enzyme
VENLTFQLGHFLEQEGIFVNDFVYPEVKKGEAGLRISLQAEHTEKDLDYLLDKLDKAKKQLGFNKKGTSLNYN